MTAKEALQVLIDNLEYSCDEEYDIVWNTLNRLEELEKLVSSTLRMDKPACERLLDLERVLKIIKEKSVDVLSILNGACETVKEYNRHHSYIDDVRNGVKPLTETEFNLLKDYLK